MITNKGAEPLLHDRRRPSMRSQLWQGLLLIFVAFGPGQAFANDYNWGVIPVGQVTTISFGQYDITKNFTDQYAFSLQAGSDASYAVTVTFDVCKGGCGNPDLSYGIYDATGRLISDTGSATLTSGVYYFQVKGTGMGAGNSVDYSGSITFNTARVDSFVSGAPEPADWLLMISGSAFLGWAVRRRKTARPPPPRGCS